MTMKIILLLSVAASVALVGLAQAAPPSARLRGTVQSVDQGSLTIRDRAGKTIQIVTGPDTKFAYVVRSSFSKIKKGSYIGTATTGSGASREALEVLVFPPAMRGAGEGHYGWDMLPDPNMKDHKAVSSSMTNGSVTSTTSSSKMVKSTMTNGNVKAASSSGGYKTITVTYKGGQEMIRVPKNVPVVTFAPATASAVSKGAAVFIKATGADGKYNAQFIAVGKDGVTPPM